MSRYSWRDFSPLCTRHYVQDSVQAERLLSEALADDSHRVFGLDLEWKPSFSRNEREHPVALLQLANDKFILLLHITSMQDIPPSLILLLQHPGIVKAGVGIQGDAQKLFKDIGISPIRSCVDLGLLARTTDNPRWKGPYKNPIGLARLTEAYEGKILEKGRITRSNWEQTPLSPAQIEYASNDAHAGFILYSRLMALLQPNHQPRFYSFDCCRGRLFNPIGVSGGNISIYEVGAPWNFSNPLYDPGPPPDPPKVKTEGNGEAPGSSKNQLKKQARKLKTENGTGSISSTVNGQAALTMSDAANVSASASQSLIPLDMPRMQSHNTPREQKTKHRPRNRKGTNSGVSAADSSRQRSTFSPPTFFPNSKSAKRSEKRRDAPQIIRDYETKCQTNWNLPDVQSS